MSGTGDEAESAGAGRRAVLMIFGGIAVVLAIAAYFGSTLRAETRARMAPPSTSASARPGGSAAPP